MVPGGNGTRPTALTSPFISCPTSSVPFFSPSVIRAGHFSERSATETHHRISTPDNSPRKKRPLDGGVLKPLPRLFGKRGGTQKNSEKSGFRHVRRFPGHSRYNCRFPISHPSPHYFCSPRCPKYGPSNWDKEDHLRALNCVNIFRPEMVENEISDEVVSGHFGLVICVVENRL